MSSLAARELNECVARAYRSMLLRYPRAPRTKFAPGALRHKCSSACTWFEAPPVFICRASGTLHLCSASLCRHAVTERECRVCPLTAFCYPRDLDDFAYSGNVDYSRRERYDDGGWEGMHDDGDMDDDYCEAEEGDAADEANVGDRIVDHDEGPQVVELLDASEPADRPSVNSYSVEEVDHDENDDLETGADRETLKAMATWEETLDPDASHRGGGGGGGTKRTRPAESSTGAVSGSPAEKRVRFSEPEPPPSTTTDATTTVATAPAGTAIASAATNAPRRRGVSRRQRAPAFGRMAAQGTQERLQGVFTTQVRALFTLAKYNASDHEVRWFSNLCLQLWCLLVQSEFCRSHRDSMDAPFHAVFVLYCFEGFVVTASHGNSFELIPPHNHLRHVLPAVKTLKDIGLKARGYTRAQKRFRDAVATLKVEDLRQYIVTRQHSEQRHPLTLGAASAVAWRGVIRV